MTVEAKVIADSVSEAGDRLTTFEVSMHRFILPQFNTYREFSRNGASSRAIPARLALERVMEDPAFPVSWPHDQPGMQGGDDLAGDDLAEVQALFTRCHKLITDEVGEYLAEHPVASSRVHKSVLSRLVEPWMWQRAIVSSTGWQNFFDQRCSSRSPLAQPEIQLLADAMLVAFEGSVPKPVSAGGWHLPYITDDDKAWAVVHAVRSGVGWIVLLKRLSAARCARVSFLTHDGRRDPELDLDLYGRLVAPRPMHASPLEHVATPATVGVEHHLGNFSGWNQLRHEVQP